VSHTNGTLFSVKRLRDSERDKDRGTDKTKDTLADRYNHTFDDLSVFAYDELLDSLHAHREALGLGFGVWGSRFWIQGGFGVWGLGFGVWGLGFGVWGLGFGVKLISSNKQHEAHANVTLYFRGLLLLCATHLDTRLKLGHLPKAACYTLPRLVR